MTYFLYIIGCDMNVSDAERVASVFNSAGFKITDDEKKADVIVAIACSVREKAVHKVLGKVYEWKRLSPRPKIIVTGCILPQDKKKFEERADLIFDIKNLQDLEDFLNPVGDAHVRPLRGNYFQIGPNYQSKFSAYVPIMTGCDNFCSYCAVPYTRGREISRSEKDILEEIKELVKNGYKEITLLGQNVNSYGVNNKSQIPNNKQISNSKLQGDKTKKLQATSYKLSQNNSEFVDLLKKIDLLDGDHWFRFYANHPKDFSDKLIRFLKSSKHFCHYIHLPLQSGDDEILRKMNRHYTAKQYLDLVNKIRKEIPACAGRPDCVLATDVIVGFPGEGEKQFQNTVKVLQKAKFDMVFIAEYSPRIGTVSAGLKDDVPHKEKERRKRFLNDEVLAKSVLENNKKMVGKTIKVLVKGKGRDGRLKGSTAGLKDVAFSVVGNGRDRSLLGNFVNVKVKKASSWGLEGELG